MKNKKLIKILLVVLSVICLFSAFSSLAFAEDLQQNTYANSRSVDNHWIFDNWSLHNSCESDGICFYTNSNGHGEYCEGCGEWITYAHHYDNNDDCVCDYCDYFPDDVVTEWDYNCPHDINIDLGINQVNSNSYWCFCYTCGVEWYFGYCYDGDNDSYCDICGYFSGPPCAHNDVVFSDDEYGHFDYCVDCGEQLEYEYHIPFYPMHYNSNSHWHQCIVCDYVYAYGPHYYDGGECFDCGYVPHECYGGKATCCQRAICVECGEEYGYYSAYHNYGELIYREEVHTQTELIAGILPHYHCVDCDTYFNESFDMVIGGSDFYEPAPTHKDNNGDYKCDVCDVIMPDHIHDFSYWVNDDTFHWKECVCGTISNKTTHKSNSPTCIERSKCFTCGYMWGDYGSHSLTSANCSSRSQCLVCLEYFGLLGSHFDGDNNFICDYCEYDFIADSEYKQMNGFDFEKPKITATNIRVGDSLYYKLWRDDDKLFRTYYNVLCTSPDGYYAIDYYHQEQTYFVDYVNQLPEGGKVYGFKYGRSYTDSGGQPAYLYNPYTESLYNRIEVYITFERDGVLCDGYSISPTSYTAYSESGLPITINGIMFNSPGTYEVTIYVRFINDMNNTDKRMSSEQTIKVELASVELQSAYDSGYNDGYNIGFQNGQISDSDFSLYGFVNAIINAPAEFIDGMLDFDVFGINMASFVKMIFTLLLVAFVVFCILKVVI